ncbi:MAG: hypothetical protein ACM3NQ_13935, partial [Bacteroidales bacterium]
MRTRLSTVPRVRTSGTAELTWNGMVPTVGTLGGALSADVAAPDSQKEAVALRASLTPQQWRVEALQPLGSGTGARLEATLKPDGDRFSRSVVTGSIEIGIRDAREAIDRLRPLGVPNVDVPAAIERLPVEVSARLSGSLAQPHAVGTARSSGLSVKSLGTLNAEASFETSLDLLTVERLRITDAQGSAVEARGTVTYASLSSNGSFEAAAPAKLLETTLPANWTTAGSIDARGSWKGTLRDPFAEVRVTGGQVAVNGLTPGPMSATAFLEGGAVRVDGRVPDLGAAMQARFTLVKPFTFTASGSLDNTNLARVATLAPAGANLPVIAGTLTAGIDVTGQLTSLALLSTHVRLERLDARVAQHPVVLTAPADISIAASDVSVAALRLQTGAATVAADGRLDKAGTGVMELIVDTPASELAGWLDASGSQTPLTADGRVHVDARATGPLGAVSLEGRATVELQQVKAGDRKVAENVRAGIAITRNTIEASQITGTILGGALDVALSAPTDWVGGYLPKQLGIAHAAGGAARVKGRVVVPAAALIDFQGGGAAPPATGSLTISVDGSALRPSLAALDGTVTVAGEEVAVQEVPFSLERPVVLTVRNGRVLVDDAQLRARGTSFTLRGGAALTDPYDVDLSLAASGSLGFLAAALPGRPSGRVTADLRLSGPSGARTAVGTVTLEQAGFVSPVHRIAFSDWSGKVDVTAESLTALDVAGTVNGGTAVLRGRLPLAPASRDTSTLSLSVRDAFVEVIKGFKSQVDADLSVAHLEDAFRIGGTVTVVSGAYREPVTAMAALFANPG